jgi:CRP-like cAMP-binding protein
VASRSMLSIDALIFRSIPYRSHRDPGAIEKGASGPYDSSVIQHEDDVHRAVSGATVSHPPEGASLGLVIAAGSVNAWVVPAVIFVLVLGASWLGVRWVRSEHVETLHAVPLFSDLSRGALMSILRSTHGVEFSPGGDIVRQGERGKGFFVLTKGAAVVTVEGSQVAALGPGSYFGEMAVIDGGPRTATITATAPVFVLELTPTALVRVIEADAAIAHAMDVELCRRLREAGEDVEPAPTVDRGRLADLSARLRRIQHPDWAPAGAGRRWLGLSRLFARGG